MRVLVQNLYIKTRHATVQDLGWRGSSYSRGLFLKERGSLRHKTFLEFHKKISQFALCVVNYCSQPLLDVCIHSVRGILTGIVCII